MAIPKRKQRVFIEMGKMRIPVKARNATTPLMVNGRVIDALHAARGVTIGCALSLMIRRELPHVHFAQITARTAALVTKVNKFGQPTDAVVYKHNYQHITDKNDTGTLKKLAVEQPGLMERTFTLYPPSDHRQRDQKKRGTGVPRGKANLNSGRSRIVLKGSARRARKAGFISKPVEKILEGAPRAVGEAFT
jgi:hypothetical protein